MLNSIIAFCLTRRAIVVFGLLLFAGAGFVAFQKLNIEAYPNPSPVILEITAQAAGLSAGEMERYYTIPIENGLYTVPGIEVIRSTSFYGLSFVRVVFKYGVDYDFAFSQTAIALQQNVTPAGRRGSQHPAEQRHGGNSPLPGGRAETFRVRPISARCRIGSCSAGFCRFTASCRSTVGAGRPRNSRSRWIRANWKPTT